MNIKHFFLSSPSAPMPDRWRQAFPSGRKIEATSLAAQLRTQPLESCIVWLSSADAQWPAFFDQVRLALPGARVVLLSNAPESQEGLLALDKGVRGYAHAYSVPSLFQELAVVVAHGGLWVGPDLMQRLVSSTTVALAKLPHATEPTKGSAWSKLSAREVQVAKAVSQGRSNKEVAAMMFISERTVKAHLGAMFEKLGIRDRLQLVLHLAASGDAPPSSAKE
jgi:DNA-binding NarL/FixJ family response regulator